MGEGNYSFERLTVWQDAMELVERVYQVTKDFPKDEIYGMTNQIRRAVTSIPVNIAEGRGRYHKKEQAQFFYNARGSLYEVITFLKIAMRLGYLSNDKALQIDKECQQILGKLSGLINAMKTTPSPFTLNPSPSR